MYMLTVDNSKINYTPQVPAHALHSTPSLINASCPHRNQQHHEEILAGLQVGWHQDSNMLALLSAAGQTDQPYLEPQMRERETEGMESSALSHFAYSMVVLTLNYAWMQKDLTKITFSSNTSFAHCINLCVYVWNKSIKQCTHNEKVTST